MATPGPNLELLAAMPVPTETPQPPWLMSFADFVSCLLSCFVLLYSLVALDQAKLNKILEGVPGRQVAQAAPAAAPKRAMAVAPEQEGRNADYLASLLQAKVEHDPALSGVTIEGQGDRVLLHLAARDLLSESAAGTAPGAPAGQAIVFALGGALGTLPNAVAVEVRPDRPGSFQAALGYAVRLAQRLEQAGANPPVMARARLAASGEAAGIDLIVFDKAPAASAH
jgi:flagellar motor protein MotB